MAGENKSQSPLTCASPSTGGGAISDSLSVTLAQRPPPQILDHELFQPIGQGAYGGVWLARNVLGTFRAVKAVYRRDFGDAQPFDREFKGIQKFEPVSRSHDGLIDILQIGRNDAEGYFYYVMELADPAEPRRSDRSSMAGAVLSDTDHRSPITDYTPRTLRYDLKAHRALTVDECLELGLALSSALEHLHAHGLVHRDVKPSNIVFVNGQPKLADIGLVAAIDDAQSMVGTAGYIPPEGPGTPQADLYSLGKVLYEAAFGKDRQEFPKLPPELANRPDQDRWLELNEVILKACESDPRQRYASAAAMHADLKLLQRGESVRHHQLVQRRWAVSGRLALGALAMMALVLTTYALYRSYLGSREMVPASDYHPVAVPLKASVFVLPFRSEGTNEVDEGLCSRVTDAFIDSVALVEGVQRSPRKSGWRWLDEDELRHALALTNAMHHVLTGRIASSNDILALKLRLFKRSSEQPLWTESYFAKTNELIAIEQRAVGELAARLGLRIHTNEQYRIDTLLTNNLEAFRLIKEGWSVYSLKVGTQSGYQEVQDLTQKALDLDPRYLGADGLDLYVVRNLALLDRAPSEAWSDVRRRGLQILSQDDTDANAWRLLGFYYLCNRRDWETADDFFNRQDRFNSEQIGHCVRACWYRAHGWFDEARVEQDQFEHVEPRFIDERCMMAGARWCEGRYAEGVRVARRTVELCPGAADAYGCLAGCLIANGDYVEGIEATHKAQEVSMKQDMTALRGFAYARMGQPEKAREVLQQLLGIRRNGPYLEPYCVARLYAALNEKEKALEWLEKADRERSDYLIFGDIGGGLRTDFAWDDLKDEPRFKELLKKVGLDQWPRPKPKPDPGKDFNKR
jgi:serine/threonine protein kinase/tetratricopeptide (TPR) repeat protein